MCVVLTPGHFNSAYYEHSFLADSMGIELVEAADLVVDDDVVWMQTIAGRVKVDVIYRRIDDDYLDPLVFRPDSMLGVPGLIAAYRAGNVAILNAPGNGIADDKAIYSYMPEIVRFYSGGEAKLPNVETFRCREPQALKYVLEHLDELVVKLVDGSGGYGMLVGPTATKAQIEEFRAALIAEPHRYIAQPTLALSTVPTLTETGLAPRHVDFRPFVLTGSHGVQRRPRRADPRRAARRIAGGEFEPGRRHQGQLRADGRAGQSKSQTRQGAGHRAESVLMLSRTASSLYWLGRYVERADFIARLVEATIRLDALSPRPAGEAAWASALAVSYTDEAFAATGAGADPRERRALPHARCDPSRDRSSAASIRRATTPARSAPRSPARPGPRSTAPG